MRYSEFTIMHDALKKSKPHLSLPKLPSKQFFIKTLKSFTKDKDNQSKRLELEDYLRKLAQILPPTEFLLALGVKLTSGGSIHSL
jgi:hypothetical protein